MTLLQDGSIALILEYSSTIDIWNITSGKLMRSYDIKGLTGYNTPYNYYSFSKLQNGAVFLYIGYPSFKICSLNLIDSKLLYITNEILSQTIYDIIAISAISDTKLVLKIRNYATNDNFIKIINPKNGENIKEFKMYNSSYEFGQRTGFNVLPDGSIASTRYNGDGFLEVFNPETSQLKISLKIANLWVCSIDDLPNGSLVTLNGSNEIKIFI
jgi:WD40 repeat protein